MTQLIYNADKNVLHIIKKPQEKVKMRGFIIQVVDNQEEAQQVTQGNLQQVKLVPVLAPNEEKALEVIANQGKITISMINYEYLKFQCELLEGLSKQTNIELVVENQMKVEFKD
jgi:hypothetical protein